GEPLRESEEHLVPSCRRGIAGQGLDDPLHAHEARALYKHRGPRPQFPSGRGDQVLHGGEMSGPFSEGLYASTRQLAHGIQTVYAALARVTADFLMEFHAALAHFPHVAEQEDFRAGFRGKHVDRRAHRIRIGVVAIVDEFRPRGSGPGLHSSADRTERRKTPLYRFEACTCDQGARGSGEGVQNIVPAVDMQLDPCRTLRGAQIDLTSEMRKAVATAHLRKFLESEIPNAPTREKPTPIPGELVVRVDHARALRPHRCEHRAV